MKYLDVILEMLLLILLMEIVNLGFSSVNKIYEKALECKNQFESRRFIYESFRKTCEGEGFADFNEWQKNCGALWKLEYIGWSEAEDFMMVCEPEKGKLYYGCWVGPDGNGEVYCRVRK